MKPMKLDADWLKKALLRCSPDLPAPLTPSSALGMTTDDEDIFKAYYGTDARFTRACETYGQMQACAREIACDLDLENLWSGLICTEWLAHLRLDDHISGKLYRDHIFHPAAVAMLGWEVLEKRQDMLEQAGAILERCYSDDYTLCASPGGTDQTWARAVQHAWLVAGFFHDHCYPYEFMHKLLKGMHDGGALEPPALSHSFKAQVDEIRRKDLCTPDVCDTIKQQLEAGRNIHAPLAAVSLLSLKEATSEDFARLVLDVAADAVLWHHSTRGKKKGYVKASQKHFRFKKHPVRYLLVLCDGLHEFCRELAYRWELPGSDGDFVTRFVASCTRGTLSGLPNALNMDYFVNCKQKICGTQRWDLQRFRDGREEFEGFINECHDLEVSSSGARIHTRNIGCAVCKHEAYWNPPPMPKAPKP